MAPTITQFELWAKKFDKKVEQALINEFRRVNIDINKPIDYETFKKWLYSDDRNLQVTYTFKNVAIATSLIGLDDVAFEESSQTSASSSGSMMRYPSLK